MAIKSYYREPKKIDILISPSRNSDDLHAFLLDPKDRYEIRGMRIEGHTGIQCINNMVRRLNSSRQKMHSMSLSTFCVPSGIIRG